VNTGAGAVINTTDHGAYQAAIDFAEEVQEGGERILDDGFDVLERIADKSNETIATVAATHLEGFGALTASQTATIKETTEALENVTNNNATVLSDLVEQNGDNFTTALSDVEGLFGESVSTIKHLAETKITEGGNLSLDTFKWLGIALLVIVAVVVMVIIWRSF